MAADRDLAVAFVRAWAAASGPPRREGWDATAATGVRGLRLLGESGAFSSFVLTEANDRAFAVLDENAGSRAGARALHADAREAPEPGRFDYVDLDPYGSPLPFLESAVRSTRTGGVLAVTATDMTVLAGAQPSATLRRYGAVPVRGRLGPEGGLRILLMRLAAEARRGARSVRPLLSYVREHYVRAYVELQDGAADDDPVDIIDPASWNGPPVGAPGPFGPLWLGPLADPSLVARLALPPTPARPREVERFVARLREEVAVDRPFFYEPNSLASRLALPEPPALERLREALIDAGHRAVRTHVRPEGLRTDATRADVEAVARSLSGAGQSQNARVRA
jgi:tRNA (guanine26-N2/guanine27-N2)-dimethyltransferase